jgi:hypothetical protein
MSALTAQRHLDLTRYFIDQNPIAIELKRSPVSSTGTGGTVRGPEATVGTLEGRLVASNRIGFASTTVTVNGATLSYSHTFVTMPDADIMIGDRFVVGSKTYEVIGVNLSPPWRLEAEVYEHE